MAPSSSITFHDVWEEALSKYIQLTTRTPDEIALLRQLQTIDDIKKEVDKKQLKFETYRKKNGNVYKALSKAIRPIVTISSIAQTSVQNAPAGGAASVILGATAYLVGAVEGVSHVYDQIEELFEQLGSFTVRFQRYMSVELGHDLRQKVVEVLGCVLEVIACAEKAVKDGRFKKYVGMAFIGKDEGVKLAMLRLNKLCQDEERLVAAISYESGQRLGTKADEIDQQTRQINEQVNELVQLVEGKVLVITLCVCLLTIVESNSEGKLTGQKRLLDRLLLTQAQEQNAISYAEYVENTLEQSGKWLFEEPAYQSWTNKEAPIFCLLGGPGQGKSFLSSIVIRHFQRAQHPQFESVAYFYIKEDDQDVRSIGNLLKTIAHRIALQDSSYFDHAVNVLTEPESLVTPRKIWQNLFTDFFIRRTKLVNRTTIVLDGLDEAPEELLTVLFTLLEDIAEPTGPFCRLSIAIFCRPEVSIFFGNKLRRHLLSVEIGDKNVSDMSRYVTRHLSNVLVIKEMNRTKDRRVALRLAKEIRDKVLDKADGIFFKVVLIMKQISRKPAISDVLKSIEETPKELEHLIYQALERLVRSEDVDIDALNELLLWVCYSKRPLFLDELYAILTIHKGQPYDALESNLEGKMSTIFKLHRTGEGQGIEAVKDEPEELNFDDLDLDDDLDTEDLDFTNSETLEPKTSLNEQTQKRFRTTEVRFSHASIRDFITGSNRSQTSLPSGLRIDLATLDLHIAEVCGQILTTDTNERSRDQQTFAAGIFFNHLLEVRNQGENKEICKQVVKMICNLFYKERSLENFIINLYFTANKTLHEFFESPALSGMLISSWFRNVDLIDFAPDEQKWITDCIQDKRFIFGPIATKAAEMWMRPAKSISDLSVVDNFNFYLVWIVHCFTHVDFSIVDRLQHLMLGRFATGLPPADIDKDNYETILTFRKFEKTSYWHSQYGLLLLHGTDKLDDAQKHFEQAIALDPDNWHAWYSLTQAYQRKAMYSDAIQCAATAIKYIPEQLTTKRITLQIETVRIMLAQDILSQNESKTALGLIRSLYKSHPQRSDIVECYIRCLYADRDYRLIVETITSFLSDTKHGRQFFSLRGVHQEIAKALIHVGQEDCIDSFVDQWLDQTYLSYMVLEIPWAYAHLAQFVYCFDKHTEQAAKMFEYILSPAFESSIRYDMIWAKDFPIGAAIDALGPLYNTGRLKAARQGEDVTSWQQKIINVAEKYIRQSNLKSPLKTIQWKREISRCGIEGAENYIKHHITDELNGLLGQIERKEPVDARTLALFGSKLMLFGDIENGLALWLTQVVPDIVSSEATAKLEEVGFFKQDRLKTMNFHCDGYCNTQFYYYKSTFDSLHRCTDCWDIDFCGDCMEQLKIGKLGFMKCDPIHKFVRLYPVQEEYVGKATTFDGAEWSFNEGWLASLQEKWVPEYPLTRDIALQCDLEEYDDIAQENDVEEAPPPYEELQNAVDEVDLRSIESAITID